jgi:glycosyltransferase involved in cell wall biosynthesis
MTGPRVTVGIPVFNMERTVARAIESVLGQTLGDFELLVSDNASTDGTGEICRRYAAADARIRYTRHPHAIPALDNFRFVLDAAAAPYFTWLAADDFMLPRLLEQATDVLDRCADVACSTPRVDFLGADGRRRAAPGTFPLLGSLRQNLRRYLYDPLDNSRFYGVFRREVLQHAVPNVAYYGADWVVVAATLRHGKHLELPDVLLVREETDPDRYMRLIDSVSSGRLARLFPLARCTRALLFDLRLPPYPCVLYVLLRINVIHHLMYCRHRFPRYGRVAYRLSMTLRRLGA